MTTRDALLAAVLASPDDDLPRLVFADYLEENGDDGWAKLIRCMCRDHSRFIECGEVWRSSSMWSWGVRKKKMVNEFAWAAVARRVTREPLGSDTGVWRNAVVTLRRGFISEVRCLLADWWDRFGPAIVRTHPVEKMAGPLLVGPSVHTGRDIYGVSRSSGGPLWPLIINHPRYKSELSGLSLMVMDRTDELEKVVSECAIQWAKSVTTTA